MTEKPTFDPSAPFEPSEQEKPAFDPSKPFDAPPQAGASALPLAIRDVPREAYQTTMDTLHSIYRHVYADPMDRARTSITQPSKGVAGDFAAGIGRTAADAGDLTKGALSALALPAAPLQGAARSLIGHPMSDVVTALAPEGKGMDYETAKGNVDLALSGAAPRGVSPVGTRTQPTPRVEPPTAQEIRDAARQNYADVRALGVEINPAPVSQLARRIETDLADLGLTQRNVPETYGVIRTLQNPPRNSVMRAQDFENARQELVQARQNPTNRREAVAANAAINHLDNYLANIPANHVIRGDAARASELFGEARGNWAAASRADTAAGKIDLGELNASTAHGGQNIDNATRQAVKQLIRPDKNGRSMAQKMGYSADEIAMMNRVARGTRTGNILRGIGKLAPTDFIKVMAHAMAAKESLGATLPISGLSYAAKRLGDRSTLGNAARLDEMVRARSPLHQSTIPPPASLPRPPPVAGFVPMSGMSGAHLGLPSGRFIGTVPAGADDQP